MSAAAASDDPFRPRTVALVLAIGILGFVGSLVFGAYAPEHSPGEGGGGHALSNGATGFSGIVRLAEATGRHPRIVRDDALLRTGDLVVLTPPSGATDLTKVLAGRAGRPTLVVLPKWLTSADPQRSGWVRYRALVPRGNPERTLAPDHPLAVRRHPSGGRPLALAVALAAPPPAAPRPLQVVTGPGLKPLLTDGAGGIVVGQFGDRPLYVLADPDLLANKGLRDPAAAAAALALLDRLNAGGADGIAFDVTLAGFGRARSPLRLAFEPPFLAMTLAIAAALLLAGWQALARFGAPRRPERAIAFGKAALVDTAALLVRKAGREPALGARYADAVRERARASFGVPARLNADAADAALDRLGGEPRFTSLAAAAAGAQSRGELLSAARALHGWRQGRRG